MQKKKKNISQFFTHSLTIIIIIETLSKYFYEINLISHKMGV